MRWLIYLPAADGIYMAFSGHAMDEHLINITHTLYVGKASGTDPLSKRVPQHIPEHDEWKRLYGRWKDFEMNAMLSMINVQVPEVGFMKYNNDILHLTSTMHFVEEFINPYSI